MKNGSKNLNAALMDQIVHGCGHIYSPCCSALFWLSSLAQIIALAKARSAPKALTAPASSLRDSISMMCTLCKACNFRHHFSQWRLFPSTKDDLTSSMYMQSAQCRPKTLHKNNAGNDCLTMCFFGFDTVVDNFFQPPYY